MNEKTLLTTQWRQKVIPPVIRLLEHNGATIGVIIDVLTRELSCQQIDVRLLLAGLVEEGVLNAEDGIYRLNHNKENDKLFQECLSYKE
jgi:hypothetical protein